MSGAATAGIGQAFGSVGSIGKELGRASAHALSSGGISKLGGGDFWSGAAAGGLGSATGSATHNFKPHWQIAGSALSGGIGAKLGGGDFLQGAAMGGIIAGANHLAHRMQTKGGIDRVFDKWLARSRKVGRALRKLNSFDRIKTFKKLVETNGTYDLKNSLAFKNDLRKHLRLEDGDLLPGTFSYRGKGGYELQDLGNYNFGVLSNAAGYSNNFVQFGAGIYQIYSGTSSSRYWFSAIGSQLLYGDEPRDAFFIQLGFHHLWK